MVQTNSGILKNEPSFLGDMQGVPRLRTRNARLWGNQVSGQLGNFKIKSSN